MGKYICISSWKAPWVHLHPSSVTEAGLGLRRVCAPVLEAFQQLGPCPDLPGRKPLLWAQTADALAEATGHRPK